MIRTQIFLSRVECSFHCATTGPLTCVACLEDALAYSVMLLVLLFQPVFLIVEIFNSVELVRLFISQVAFRKSLLAGDVTQTVSRSL